MSPQAQAQYRLEQIHALAEQNRQVQSKPPFPSRHICSEDGTPIPFHPAQSYAYDSTSRIVGLIAGTGAGKTTFGPWWLAKLIEERGSGDYLAVTSSYDLFKLKMLPEFLRVFEEILGLGRFWLGDKIFELRDPKTGEFRAKRSVDPMYARVILRSAQSLGGLESATVKGMWLDEAGQDEFTGTAWKALRRRGHRFLARVLLTTTLYNLGWVFQQIIEPAEKDGTKQIETDARGGEIEVTTSTTADITVVQCDSVVNPQFNASEFEHARATMPDDEFQMFYRGRVAQLRHLIYDIFDRKKHTCARFPIPVEWKRWVGLDFGGVNTAALFFAEEKIHTANCKRNDGGECVHHDKSQDRLYCYREYLSGGKSAREHSHDLIAGEPKRPTAYGGAASEGQWRREFAEGGLPIKQPTIGDVEIGIARLYEQIKTDRLIVFSDLEGWLDELGRYRRKRDRAGNITQEIENKQDYHYCDSARYLVSSIRGSTNRAGVDFA